MGSLMVIELSCTVEAGLLTSKDVKILIDQLLLSNYLMIYSAGVTFTNFLCVTGGYFSCSVSFITRKTRRFVL